MKTLVFVESTDGKIRKTSLEAVSYAAALGGAVVCVAMGTVDKGELEALGKAGASKVLHASDERLNQGLAKSCATVLLKAMQDEKGECLVAANSSLATPVAAAVAGRLNGSLATNVVELPDVSSGFVVKRSIYTGKAFSYIELKRPVKVIVIKKNAAEVKATGSACEVVPFVAALTDADLNAKVTSTEKATGEVLLPEAEIVVSGGRGMKGPEHWGILEELAHLLHAATGCSKPVSDMGWRPHHEHVGQTGVKVAPQLYIAVGISGAIQHLAGVNSSKCIVVINKDADAPFFKAADYGIVGDAFDVVPKLTAAIKAAR